MEEDIPHAEFAFLSVCHTAIGDKEMPDEVTHLAAGRGLRASLAHCEVDDAVANHIVKARTCSKI
jgi:hypothetical protein